MEAQTTAVAVAALATASVALVGAQLGPGADAGAAGTNHHVHIVNFDMDPEPLTIEAGDTVTWHNHDSASHSATEGSPGDGRASEWDTTILSTGETASITFDQTASYEYYCKVHPSTMNGFGLDVAEPPAVSIDAPSEGATVSGTVDVAGSASDSDGSVQRVEVRIDDGDWQQAQGTTSWSFSWDTTAVGEGDHRVQARSFDGSAFSDVATVNVTVDNPKADLVAGDLRVEDRTAGRQATLAVTVVNGGDVEAPASSVLFTYDVRGETRTIGDVRVPPLEPGETSNPEITWDTRGQVGEFTVRAAADRGRQVPEGSEGNNVAEATVCFPGADAACRVPGADPVGTVGG